MACFFKKACRPSLIIFVKKLELDINMYINIVFTLCYISSYNVVVVVVVDPSESAL